MIKVLMLSIFITGCSTINYSRLSNDGTKIEISGWSIGTDSALSGLNYSVSNGEASFKVDGLNQDQTNMVQAIITGAIKGLK